MSKKTKQRDLNSPKGRLESFIDYVIANRIYKIKSESGFETYTGLGNSYVRNMKKSMSQQSFEKVRTFFTDLNLDWINTGRGEMLIKNNDLTDTPTRLKQINANPDISKGFHSDSYKDQSQPNIDTIEKMLNEKLNPIKEQLDIISRLLNLENRVTKVENKLEEITEKGNKTKNQ